MSEKTTQRCGVCDQPVAPRKENPAFPFCKPRCRQIDLGKWLGGEYVISRSLFPAHLMPPSTDDD